MFSLLILPFLYFFLSLPLFLKDSTMKKDRFDKNLDLIFTLFKVTWDFVLTFPILSPVLSTRNTPSSNLVTLFFVNQIQFPRHELRSFMGISILEGSWFIGSSRIFVPCNSLKRSWIDSFTRRFAIVSSDADEFHAGRYPLFMDCCFRHSNASTKNVRVSSKFVSYRFTREKGSSQNETITKQRLCFHKENCSKKSVKKQCLRFIKWEMTYSHTFCEYRIL